MPTIACIDSSVYCCADSVRKVKQTSKLVVDLIGMINNGMLFLSRRGCCSGTDNHTYTQNKQL